MKIKNIIFKSPIIAASGTYGYGDEVKSFVDLSKIGGVITKSITLNPRLGNNSPRIIESKSGMLNSIGLANIGVEKFCSEKLPLLNKINTHFIVSVAGSEISNYIQVISKIEQSEGNHIGYEINISCPNVKEGGMSFGVDKDVTYELTKKLREITNKILIIKLSPNVTSITDIALAAQKGGADAVSAINTIVAMGIDIETFKPKLHTTFGGLSGPAIKPIALAHVHKIFKAINIPIIGIGGISSAADVIEFILAGSDLVQVGTLNYRNPNIAVDIFNELKKYCVKNKIDCISDLKGKLKYYE